MTGRWQNEQFFPSVKKKDLRKANSDWIMPKPIFPFRIDVCR
jgi:hypothetical protein